MIETKKCNRCHKEKTLSEFIKLVTDKPKEMARCADCRNKVRRNERKRIAADTEKHKSRCREWDAKNAEKRKAITKKQNDRKTKDQQKESFIKSAYGITLADYNRMLQEQNGVCAICGQPESRKSRYGGICKLHIDHDHELGHVRGLLCQQCNLGIGALKENPELLLNAIQYLRTRGVPLQT